MTSPTTSRRPDIWVRFLQTVEPTSTDRTRYDAGSVWAVSAERGDELVAGGEAEFTSPPPAALREVTEPLEPLPPPPDPTAADDAPAIEEE
jgi:hypothetical protein